MKRILFVFILISASGMAMAQNGQDFSTFGNELIGRKNIVEIFPNPSVDFLNVTIENADLQKTELTVYSIIGAKFKVEIEIINPDQYRIDVRDIPQGYYLLSIKDASTGFSKTFKFLKR